MRTSQAEGNDKNRHTWKNERLQKLFTYYNKKYWNGRPPECSVVNRDLKERECLALLVNRRKRILLDLTLQKSDLAIRETLLHEMCHLAATRDRYAHGCAFFAQLERLLSLRPGFRVRPCDLHITMNYVRRSWYPLSHEAVARVDEVRLRYLKQVNPVLYALEMHWGNPNYGTILERFEEAALKSNSAKAHWTMSRLYGLIDATGKPADRWSNLTFVEGRCIFNRTRRELQSRPPISAPPWPGVQGASKPRYVM